MMPEPERSQSTRLSLILRSPWGEDTWTGKYPQGEGKGTRYAIQQTGARLFWSLPHTCEQDSVTELAMEGHLDASDTQKLGVWPFGAGGIIGGI